MKRYRLIISPEAIDAIAGYRDYIARVSGKNNVAARWVEEVLDPLKVLETMPEKFALAEEDTSYSSEIRRTLIGKYLALYTIDESYRVVRIIGFRHGSRLPRPSDLPDKPPE